MSIKQSVFDSIVIWALLLVALIIIVLLGSGFYSPPSIDTIDKLTTRVIDERPTEIVSYHYVNMRGGGYWHVVIVATDGELYNVNCDWRFCYHLDKIK